MHNCWTKMFVQNESICDAGVKQKEKYVFIELSALCSAVVIAA